MLEPFPFPAIARDQWPALVRRFPAGWGHRCKPPVHNQGLQAKCNAAAVVTAMEHVRAVMGLDSVTLDMNDLYERVPRTPMGTVIGDVLNESEAGVMPVGGTEDDRRHFRAQWWECVDIEKVAIDGPWAVDRVQIPHPSFDKAYTALLYGYPCVTVISKRRGFTTLPDGRLRTVPPPGGQAFDHGIYAYKPGWFDGEPYIWFQDSQGAFSTKTGSCVAIPESMLAGNVFYACRSVTYYRGGG